MGLRLAALLMAFAMAGCAANREGEGDTPREVLRVVVQNENTLTQQPRINLLAADGGGISILVGRLTSFGTETFTVRRADLRGSYRLQAQATGGRTLVSPTFGIRGNQQVNWDLRTNTVLVRNLDDSGGGSN